MILAHNNIEVPSSGIFALDPFLLDAGSYAVKLSVQVLSLNSKEEEAFGPVLVQVSESPQHTFEDELNTAQWLEVGFNSRSFATPITGFRVRTPTEQELTEANRKTPALPGLIHYVLYG